jgi:D-aminopeptidase
MTGRMRARELGIVPGALPPGPVNAITDVPGVRVGHATLIEGSDIGTGVTAIVHDALTGRSALPAALFTFNGFGKMVGSTQIDELGEIETPVLLTSTLATFTVADALVGYILALPGNEELVSVNPFVAETNDQYLSDTRRRPITAEHALSAIRDAKSGPVPEGCVGAGTGTGALGFKAGIGTASRLVRAEDGTSTVGVLVQANFGGTLTVLGVPIPAVLAGEDNPHSDPRQAAGPSPVVLAHGPSGPPHGTGQPPGNSCVIVLATDAPLDSRQLGRVARRCITGMGRTGSDFSGHSGDYALALSTVARATGSGRTHLVPENDLNVFFSAAMEATEEAILNSLFMAESMTGFRGHSRLAVPLDQVRDLVKRNDAGGKGPER